MNKDEFNQWLEQHCVSQPGLRKWIGESNPTDDPLALQRMWWSCLSDVSFDHARQVTIDIVRGDQPGVPYAETVAAVRKRARLIALRERFSLPDVDCSQCDNTGFVHVYSPTTVRWVLSGKQRQRLATCVAVCACPHGRRRDGAVFDDRCMLRADHSADHESEWKRIAVFYGRHDNDA